MATLRLEYPIDDNDPISALTSLLDEIITGQQDITFEHKNAQGEVQWVSIADVVTSD